MIYSPAEDSYLLSESVKKYSKGKKVLDMGSGSGIQAITAIESKPKSVTASDINKDSISLLKKKGIEAIKSDLFEKIKGKFDLIIFNPPYLPEDSLEDKESAIATTGGKEGDEIILRFLKGSKKHLNEKGIILLLISSLTPQKRVYSLLKELNYKKKIIAEKKIFMEKLIVFKIENI